LTKESFRYDETKALLKLLDEAARRSHMNRAQAFDDTLRMIVCTLGRPLMENEYMEVVERHTEGRKGRRGCDSIAQFFGQLVHGMTETNRDLLGDLFEGAITRGEAGQFLTPEPICEMLARMNLPVEPTDLDGRRTVGDPCCGSGRMLLAAAAIQPNWQFVGQDVDVRCVRMAAINLALRNRFGHVVWGNSLAVEQRMVLETGRLEVWGNAIRHREIRESSPEVRELAESQRESTEERATNQLRLF
jgi:type I restriction-modification system DNA methylase subunit